MSYEMIKKTKQRIKIMKKAIPEKCIKHKTTMAVSLNIGDAFKIITEI